LKSNLTNSLAKMSATNTEIILSNDMGSKRKINTLPAKYSKFASFAFWLFGEMKTSQIISDDSYSQICNFTNLIGADVPTQIEFYERFFAELSTVGKLLKAANKKVAQKPPKVQKPRAQKNKKTQNTSISNNDIISQIVLRANSVDNADPLPHDNSLILFEPSAVIPPKPVSQKKTKSKTRSSSENLVQEEVEVGIPTIQTVEEDIQKTPVLKSRKGKGKGKQTVSDLVTETTTDVAVVDPPVESEGPKTKTHNSKKKDNDKGKGKGKGKQPVCDVVTETTVAAAIEIEEESKKKGKGKGKPTKAQRARARENPPAEAEGDGDQTTKKGKKKGKHTTSDADAEISTLPSGDDIQSVSDTDYQDEDDDEGELVEMSVVMIDDVEYYFDSDNNLYDINKNIVGTFDSDTLQISYA